MPEQPCMFLLRHMWHLDILEGLQICSPGAAEASPPQ